MGANLMKIFSSNKLKYLFDNIMAKGTLALVYCLFFVTTFLVLISAVFVWFYSYEKQRTFLQQIWVFSELVLDRKIPFGQWELGLVSVLLVITSIFVLSILIGILTAGIEGKLEELKKGRSIVIETGHSLLLGWSPHIFLIISELIIANENQKDSCIVILADVDKTEMEQLIRDRIGGKPRARIICRRGNQTVMTDLDMVSINFAKSIIVLPPSMSGDADILLIKTLLTIVKNPCRRSTPYHITSVIYDERNIQVAKMVGKNEVILVNAESMISKIIAQTSRQPGLIDVYQEILDFNGVEIYFKCVPELIGETYGEISYAFDTSAIIGFKKRNEIILNPPLDTVYENDDELIAITEDSDTFNLMLKSDYDIFNEKINDAMPKAQKKEHVLILSWNQRATAIINELNNYMVNDSQITVLVDQNNAGSGFSENSFVSLDITVNLEIRDISDRYILEQLDLSNYDHIILLARSDLPTERDVDSFTLVTLLQLNDIANLQGVNPPIVSEILDNRNKELAESAGVDDFVISDRLVSLVLTQISENKHLEVVFGELLSIDGIEIYLKPASDYIELEQEYNFYTILAAAGRKNETAIGYNRPQTKNKHGNGMVVSPEKGKKVKFIAGDQIIVLGQLKIDTT